MLPESIFNLHGWCTKEKAERLYKLVKDNKPLTVVELGIFGGRSYIPMALALKDNNNNGVIIGVDPWSKTASTQNYDKNDPNYIWWNELNYNDILKSFETALRTYNVTSCSRYIKKTSLEAINEFNNITIDIMHQDGNHSEVTSCEEVELYSPKIKSGGIWIMDDTNWETTRKAQELLISKGFKLSEDYDSWKIYIKI